MTDDDQEKFAVELEAHFPQVTTADSVLAWERLAIYPFSVARQALSDHRVNCGLHAYRPDPNALAAVAARIAQRDKAAGVQVNGLSALQVRQEREEGQRNAAAVDRVKARVAELPPAVRDELKALALAEMEPAMRPMFAKKDPTQSPVLADAIARLAAGYTPAVQEKPQPARRGRKDAR